MKYLKLFKESSDYIQEIGWPEYHRKISGVDEDIPYQSDDEKSI